MELKLSPQPFETNERRTVPEPGIENYTIQFDGWYRTYQVYVPPVYDGNKSVPLVITLHGAAHPRYASAMHYTTWAKLAKRENFIVLYPNSLYENDKVQGIGWNLWRDYDGEGILPDDIKYIDHLIDLICEQYNIDKTRIYMQGQSNGDNMTSTYIFERGNRIAAAATTSGPIGAERFVDENGEYFRLPNCPVPVIRRCGSEDVTGPLGKAPKSCYIHPEIPKSERVITEEERLFKWQSHLLPNIYTWKRTNQTKDNPRIGLHDNYSWFVWDGDECDYTFYTIEGGEHGPLPDLAENIWTYFFTGWRLVDGKHIRCEPEIKRDTDKGAVALASGVSMAYVDNEKVELTHPVFEKNGDFYVAACDLQKLFPNCSVELTDENQSCNIRYEGGEAQFAAGNCAFVKNERVLSTARTEWVENTLYLPMMNFAHKVLSLNCISGRGACYLSTSNGTMSYNLARMIREILGAEHIATLAECRELEVNNHRSRAEDDAVYEAVYNDYCKAYGIENTHVK